MDFDFTEDQNMLRDLAREFLTEQVSVAHIREMMEDETGYDKDLYRRFLGLGLIPLPEEYGGAGFGMVETAIIMEEMGRIPYPGPFFGAVVLAGQAIMQSGDDKAMARYLPDIANGDLVVSLALLEESSSWTPATIQATATKDGDNYTLNGAKRFVPWGAQADVFLVVARTGEGTGPDGISLFAVQAGSDGVEATPETMLDLNSRTATVKFSNASGELIGTEGNAWVGLDRAIQRAAVAASAEMLGAARRSHEMSSASSRPSSTSWPRCSNRSRTPTPPFTTPPGPSTPTRPTPRWPPPSPNRPPTKPPATSAAKPSRSTAASASPGNTTCTSTGNAPSTRKSSTATATTTANASCRKCWRGT